MYGIALTNVHVFCFAASYAVALSLEVSRLFLRAPVRIIGTLGFSVAGLFAQTVYIVMRTTSDPQKPPPLSSWYDWLLLIAWGVAAVYLVLKLRRPQAATGIFMLPMVLALIGIACIFREVPPFPRNQSLMIWGIVHGTTLLAGSVVVMLGFLAGLMYLVQSHRLKRKLPPRQGFKLPSLEWLQKSNKQALLVSSWLLAAGLIAGLALNVVKRHEGMPWTDPVIWTSGVLFVWLLVVLIFESLYRPAQQGRKVVYLTLASFVFLGFALGMVLLGPSEHASPSSTEPPGSDTGGSPVELPVVESPSAAAGGGGTQ
jgi:ABC-type transport system involved in cytochrome c biogenesis permease subunit